MKTTIDAMKQARGAMLCLWCEKPSGGMGIDSATKLGVKLIQEAITALGVAIADEESKSPTLQFAHPNPVFEIEGEWWFYDETWADVIGPFMSEFAAELALVNYCKTVLG